MLDFSCEIERHLQESEQSLKNIVAKAIFNCSTRAIFTPGVSDIKHGFLKCR